MSDYRPWFQRRPGTALALSLGLFVGVAALRVVLGSDASLGITMLFVLPISLVGLARGRAAGIVAGVAAMGFTSTWVVLADVDLSLVGWASRAVPLLTVGYLLGDASEQLQRAEARRVQAEARSLRQRQAVEVNDNLVQGMVAAKWSFEAGRVELGLETLEATISGGQRLVSHLMREDEQEASVLNGTGGRGRDRHRRRAQNGHPTPTPAKEAR